MGEQCNQIYCYAVFWLLLLLCPPLLGQFHISRFGTKEGLSESHVFCVLQDSRGFMWFGTRDGLNRFDGYEWKIYQNNAKDPQSISSNYIYALWEDNMGDLWIGTNGGGLNRFNRASETFTRYLHKPNDSNSLSHNTVRALAGQTEAGATILWIGTTGGGLNRFDSKTGTFTRYGHNADDVNSIGSNNISCLALHKNTIWIGTNDAGLNSMALSRRGRFTRFSHQPGNPHDIADSRIWSLHFDREGALWLGLASGLKRMAPNGSEHFEPIQPSVKIENVSFIMQAKDSIFWIGTREQGLLLFDYATGQITKWLSQIEKPVTYIYQDNKGNYWVTHYGAGVSLMAANPFVRFADGTADETVNALLLDASGKLWFGGEKKGLRQQASGAVQEGNQVPVKSVLSILKDRRENFWIGTRTQGLYLYNSANRVLTNYQSDLKDPNSLAGGNVNVIFQEPGEVLWVGTDRGLSRMEPDQPGIFSTYRSDSQDLNSLSNHVIKCIYRDPSDENAPLWIGTFYGGLNRLDSANPGTFISYQHEQGNADGLSSNTVFAIHKGRDGFLWLGTTVGLNRFDPENGKTRSYLKQDGLESNLIYCILEDDRGSLWLSTPKGLSRFDPASEKFQGYNRHDGLPVDDFRERCGFRGPDGRLFFGGIGGVIAFFPKDIHVDRTPPQMAITSFLLNNHPVQSRKLNPYSPLTEPKSIDLSHDDRSLAFRFAAMHSSAPKKNRHMYRLVGFDKDWIETDVENRWANYTNLDPDSYIFQIKGSNKDGFWSEVKSLKIHIPPHPWLSWWAYTLYTLALIALITGYVIGQRQKLAQKQRLFENERLVTERLRQVDALKDEFLANTSHELRTPLHGMVGLAESLIDGVTGELPEATRGNLAMIVSSGRRLSNLVDDILDFSKLRNKGLELQFRAVDLHGLTQVVLALIEPLARTRKLALFNEIPKNLPPVRGDEDRLQQILHNLIGNAIKFTDQGSVTISAELGETDLLLRVTDTGVGIDPADLERIFLSFQQVDAGLTRVHGGTGLGLAICKQLVALHGGLLQASSSPGKGSSFFFKLALAKEEEAAGGARLTTRFENPEDITFPPAETNENQDHHILIVDDDPINRQVLRNHLALLNHRITEAADGAEALAAIEREHFDLVLLDIMMPRISGYEVCRKIRERLGPHELPVIFLSARNLVPDLSAGFAAGANDYLTKPVARQELLSRLDLHLRLRESVHQLVSLNEEQRALDEVVRKMNQEMALEGVLQAMLDLGITHIPEAEGGAFFLWHEEHQRFEVVASSGYETHELDGTSFSHEVLADRYLAKREHDEPVTSELVRRHSEPEPLEHVNQLPLVCCMLSMPLHLEGELKGFLILDNFSHATAFDKANIRMLERFREHAVSALAKARFLREIQLQNKALMQSQEQLMLQDKMVSLGTLTSGIGHEINNPTNFVNGSAQNMGRDLKKFREFLIELAGEDVDPEVLHELESKMAPLFDHIDTIKEGAQRITSIVRDLRTFSRQDGGEAYPVDLGSCLSSTLNLVRPNYSDQVAFIEDFAQALVVKGRQTSLNQVFMNLIVNACQAMVPLSRRDGTMGQLLIRTEREGEWGRVIFEDTGGGIPEEIRMRIFEPFFTTKGVGEGTGLGLSISYGIVESHGGQLLVDSVEGKGTVFTVSLPIIS